MKGKVIVITGASSGIGEATARVLSQQGATVVLGARREERLKALAQSITGNGGLASYRTTDVTKLSDVQKLVNHAIEEYGRIDVINISSTAGHVVEPTSAVYARTKFAVMAISEGLRKEATGRIKVTVVSPGVTATELGNDISDEFSSTMLKEIRKTSMSPEVIANAIAYVINQPNGVDVSEVLLRETGRI